MTQRIHKPAWFIFMALAVFFVACMPVATNWPGISANGDRVLVAHGSEVIALNVPEQREVWRYAGEEGGVQFSAAPSIADESIVLGDSGTQAGMFSTGLTTAVYKLSNNGDAPPTTNWVNSDREGGISGRVFAEPLQANDLIYVVTSDNHLVALESDTGTKVWDVTSENANWSKPVYGDGLIFVTSTDRHVYALDANDGSPAWQKRLDGSNAAAPLLVDGVLYVASFDSNLYAFDPPTGDVLWQFAADDTLWSTPEHVAGIIYLADLAGRVYAVDAETGEGIWDSSLRVSGSVQAGIAHDGDSVFVGSASNDNETGWLASIDMSDGRVRWENSVPGPVHNTPVLVGDSVVIAVAPNGGNLQVIVYDAATGAQQWLYTPSN